MTANDERIRTTHIGSLPRPPELLALLEARQNGEQPRVSFNWYVADRLSGIDGEREQELWADLQAFPDYAEETFETDVIDLSMQPVVAGPIEYTGREDADAELDGFRDALVDGADIAADRLA